MNRILKFKCKSLENDETYEKKIHTQTFIVTNYACFKVLFVFLPFISKPEKKIDKQTTPKNCIIISGMCLRRSCSIIIMLVLKRIIDGKQQYIKISSILLLNNFLRILSESFKKITLFLKNDV